MVLSVSTIVAVKLCKSDQGSFNFDVKLRELIDSEKSLNTSYEKH